jgi:diphosphomevalonate decarboxylase
MNSIPSYSKIFASSAPSNIAFIKYWGKKDTPTTSDNDRNLPLNSSLSLTLSHARTFTAIGKAQDPGRDFQLYWENQIAPEKDIVKVKNHVKRVFEHLGVPHEDLKGYFVFTKNNFPMGTGLASSASAFAALTTSVLGFFLGEKDLLKQIHSNERVISSIARRGSGSASRSLTGPFVKWDNDSAQRLSHSNWKLFDTIVVFSKEHKKVPSSEGHKSAASSPLFAKRLAVLQDRMSTVEKAIQDHDIRTLGKLLELEALELHEIARTGTPSITYATDQTLQFLSALKSLKDRDFFFTLDAGPNVHIISDRPIENEIKALLRDHNLNAEIWLDESGTGARIETIEDILKS